MAGRHVEQTELASATTTRRTLTTRYCAVDGDPLRAVMTRAGFTAVERLAGVFRLPVWVGCRAAAGRAA